MAGQGNNVAATIWGCTIFHCSLIQQPKETLSWKHFSFNLSSFFDLNKLGKNKQLSLLQKLPYGSLVDHVTLTVFKFHNLAVYNANICINKESCWNWCLDTQVLNIFFFLGWGLHWRGDQENQGSTNYWCGWLLVHESTMHCSGRNGSHFSWISQPGQCTWAACGLLLCF